MSQKDIGNKIPIYKLKAGKEVENYYDEFVDLFLMNWLIFKKEFVDSFFMNLLNF